MFAGIVEACVSIQVSEKGPQLIRITVEKPTGWDDLKDGDSIAVNGICLTLEKTSAADLTFALGPETLRVSGWDPNVGDKVNLERSLQFGDRVHGHLVNGHVDETGRVVDVQDLSETRDLLIQTTTAFVPFLWRKGSVAVNGVSLTINKVTDTTFGVGLIPETLKRTNLGALKTGDSVHLEADAMARAWYHWRNLK